MGASGLALACAAHVAPPGWGETLWSSAGTGWAGFPLEVTRLRGAGQVRGVRPSVPLAILCLGGVVHISVRTGRGEQRGVSTRGALVFALPDTEYELVSWAGGADLLFAGMHLRPGVAWNPGTATHPTQFLVRDARVAMLLRDMLAEAQANAPSGRAYAQALSAALALHLNARYAPAAGPGTRLAPEISDLLRAHVRAHLAEELPVADLAAMARLSVSRFSELFRGSFHCAPHQYVVGQRVREAMRLLAEGRLSLAEVAQATGFADQSHLTRSFRRLADTTPGRYRAHARGAARLVQRGAGARAAPRDSWTPLGKPLRSP